MKKKKTKKGKENSSVISIDPFLCIACVTNQFLWLEPQLDLIFGCLWSIASMDDVPVI